MKASIGLCALGGVLVSVGSARASSETILHNFSGVSFDGANPSAGMIGFGNALYGVTYSGGSCPSNSNGCGTVFRIVPGSSSSTSPETILYEFKGGVDGIYPSAGLVADSTGALYGTTVTGGAGHQGIAFRLAPPSTSNGPWTETVIHSFAGGTDGLQPITEMVIFQGALFGTTSGGGGCASSTSGCGIVFRLSPPTATTSSWTETVIYRFAGGIDGSNPGDLVVDPTGSFLYGSTSSGGNGFGTVYKLVPPAQGQTQWTKSAIYLFQGGKDAASPSGNFVFDSSGALYGAGAGGAYCSVPSGCGAVFRLSPPASGSTKWSESILYNFTGVSGSGPSGGLSVGPNGRIYGTTFAGGTGFVSRSDSGNGVVYSLAPPSSGTGAWVETPLHDFASGTRDGQVPRGLPAISTAGALFGITFNGGNGCPKNQVGCGIVFEITP